MNSLLIPALYVLAGICICSALHHWLIAWQPPVNRTHLLFGLTCFGVALYVIFKTLAYQSDTAETLVEMRRMEGSIAVAIFVSLAWFVADYTDVYPRRFLIGLSLFMGLVFCVNLTLPQGIVFSEMPELRHITLPWGEKVADVRAQSGGIWFKLGWIGILSAVIFCISACIRQYKLGARQRAMTLGLALSLFLGFVLSNHAVNFGWLNFAHTAEFGFIALVSVMSTGLSRELRDSGRRMKDILNNVPALVYMKDTEGRYLMVNKTYEKTLQISEDELIGKSDFDVFPAPQAEALRLNDRRALEARALQEFEEVVGRFGTERTYRSLKFPLFDPYNQPYAVCGVSTDVTEVRKAEEEVHHIRNQLRRADRVAHTGALSTSIAHELNQPLAAILGNAQAGIRLLAAPSPDLREIREILDDIVRDDKRASAVISSLLAMARRHEAERKPINLSEVIEEVFNLIQVELSARGITSKFDLKPETVIIADRVQIQQILLNLAINSIDAMNGVPPDHRYLHVAVAETDDKVNIIFRDTGVGIAKNEAEKVFEPFFTTKNNGTGMGLAICRSIVEAHDGQIQLEPNPDPGTTFKITLPR